MLRPGETFHSEIDGHLWVVLTEPDESNGLLCVSLVTQRSYSDTTTVCQPGEHPFIKRPTCAHYGFAEFYAAKRLRDGLEAGTFTKKQPCSDDLFRKIFDGVERSDFTPKRILNRLGSMR